jgi:hypothetical protein
MRLLALSLLIAAHLVGWFVVGGSAGALLCIKSTLFYSMIRVRLARLYR